MEKNNKINLKESSAFKGVLMKELINSKYRWFIWAILVLVIVGFAILSYINIVSLQMDTESSEMNIFSKSKKQNIKWDIYTNKNGYSVKYPQDWYGETMGKMVIIGVNRELISKSFPVKEEENKITELDTDSARFSVNIFPGYNDIDSISNWVKGFDARPSDWKLEDKNSIQVDEQNGLKYLYRKSDGIYSLVYIPYKGEMFRLEASTTDEKKYGSILNQMIFNFKFTK